MSQDQDRTERATPKRERDAREKGQVARSRELTTAVLVAGGAAVLIARGDDMTMQAAQLLREALIITPADLASTADLARVPGRILRAGLMIVAPILALGFAAALVGPLMLGGWNFSSKALMPQFSRLDPMAGLGRIFSGRALMDLLLGLLKVSVLGGIGAAVLWSQRAQLAGLARMDPLTAMGTAGSIIMGLLGWLALGLGVIAALDVPWQWFRHGKELRMTRQEVRDEYKQSEGRPEVKAKIRQVQQSLARSRMMDAVPTADVIVTNPTHYAVALRYSSDRMRAPKVVAKGADVVAAAIRDLAREHRVPIVSAPPLARALYRSVALDQEIPAALFQAVAQVLSYVYQLRRWRAGTPAPVVPEVGDLPGGEIDPAPPS
ncbi:flagellar biosynthetic protein FlhB [Panacagrimonas perspica]|uniref:Flagellar biosynthetic protein FlhB n=1 Tax=Panacagrimonas perspica TaxID=381431 RepID=A0A4S3K4X5_9GAMM|nr:flagellar biosynthesis protein FlhB [Panacagrimonas perspica]TDU25806.1 flagellar biosynthetic protein FlhB [Panacagrimonas perspica]THD02824.1 flagellar biosynthesis protein FlhB [Panacagrimonas perspica]